MTQNKMQSPVNVARLSPPTHPTLDGMLDATQAEHFGMLDAAVANPSRYGRMLPILSHLIVKLTAAERAAWARVGSDK